MVEIVAKAIGLLERLHHNGASESRDAAIIAVLLYTGARVEECAAPRTSPTRDLLIQALPAVVASMLGYHPARTELLAAEAGATWKRYATGDHTRRS